MIDSTWLWKHHIDFICIETKQRIYFLRRLRSFEATQQVLLLFFISVLLSVLQRSAAVGFSCLTVTAKSGPRHWIQICLMIMGQGCVWSCQRWAVYKSLPVRLSSSISGLGTCLSSTVCRFFKSNLSICRSVWDRIKLYDAMHVHVMKNEFTNEYPITPKAITALARMLTASCMGFVYRGAVLKEIQTARMMMREKNRTAFTVSKTRSTDCQR